MYGLCHPKVLHRPCQCLSKISPPPPPPVSPSVSGQGSFPEWQTTISLLCPHRPFLGCVHGGWGSGGGPLWCLFLGGHQFHWISPPTHSL